MAAVSDDAEETGGEGGERTENRLSGHGIDHPEDHLRARARLHVDGDAPRLASRVQDANLQVRGGFIVLALVAVGLASQRTVEKSHGRSPFMAKRARPSQWRSAVASRA